MHCILRRGPQAPAHTRFLALQTLCYFHLLCLILFVRTVEHVPQVCRQMLVHTVKVIITYGLSHMRAQTSYNMA